MSADIDVIAAVATAQGRAGIGIVRVSGRSLEPFVAALLGRLPPPRSAVRAVFRGADGRPIDEGLALYFAAPSSYTGEDVLELHGHGGPVVLRMLLRRCIELGARLAEPGEFTRRAFLNDKLDLAQAEAVADVIDAATETAARCALRSLRGEFSQLIHGFADQLLELRALVEATLDFPEEDIDAEHRLQAHARLGRLREQLRRALEQARRGSVLRAGLQVVLAGQPNVGKSSLLNKLAGEDVAIVTEIPGTTRDAVRQTIQVEGVPMNIIDTAGLRDTSDTVERFGIARAWDAIERADVLLLVVDARTGVTPEDERIRDRLPRNLARIVVFNKIDLCGVAAASEDAEDARRIRLSAKTGEGVDLLRAAMVSIAGWQATNEDIFMARERHVVCLERAAEALERAAGAAARLELFAEELRIAQQALDAITGETTPDDVLGEIFSRFCIGK
ncbi:MAG TPA: tRNA uridine-5-carboxymethylaminomethyl(34) synthesis GTPase MnmE [Burkholderiales bacterium]|nr:tRNA uridine-5-carboxymethylaminomethyl(34) synthesis GTPase MnmE [Burkholderiales bacterium]